MKEYIYCGIIFLFLCIILVQWLRHRKKTIDRIDCMSGEEFEEWIAGIFAKMGYRVCLTEASNDYGADVIAWNKEEKIIIQAKRYSSPVGIKAVQELAGAMAYYEEDELVKRGIVITNSTFTRQAQRLAQKCKITLWDRNFLIENILSDKNLRQAQLAEEIPTIDMSLKVYVIIGDNNRIKIYSSQPIDEFEICYEQELTGELEEELGVMKKYEY